MEDLKQQPKRNKKKHNQTNDMYLVQQETHWNWAQMHSNKIDYTKDSTPFAMRYAMNQIGQIYLQIMPSECTNFFKMNITILWTIV